MPQIRKPGSYQDDYFGHSAHPQDARVDDMYGRIDQRLEPLLAAGDYKDAFAMAAADNDPSVSALTDEYNLDHRLFLKPLTSDQMTQYYQAFQPYENNMEGQLSGYFNNDPNNLPYNGTELRWGTNLHTPQDIQTAVNLNMSKWGGIPNPAQVLGNHPRIQATALDSLKAIGQHIVLPIATAMVGGGAFGAMSGTESAAVGAGLGAANAAANGGNPWVGALAGGVGASGGLLSEETGMNPALANVATRTAAGGISGGGTGAAAAGLGGALGYGINQSGAPSYLGNAAGSALSSYIRNRDPEQAGLTGLQRGVSGYLSSPYQQHAARGGSVRSLHDILNGPSFSEQPAHFDDGGYVDYFTPNIDPTDSNYISSQYTPPEPDYSNLVLPQDQNQLSPYTGASLGDIIGWDNVVPTDNYGNVNLSSLGGSYTGANGQTGSGSGSGTLGKILSSLAGNPSLIGALLGGGLGLAGALGSNNGQNTMLANYKPTPPPMFQGSGPSASNMYGNFSATPRTRLNPTNIDYAHAGEQPTPGGNMFFSPSGGAPTAPMSQTSPMQQYGAQPPTQQQTPASPSVDQLINLIAHGNTGSNVFEHPWPIMRQGNNVISLNAKGGPIHEHGPLAASMNPHLTPASKGGPNYIRGPGDGTSDDIDAKLSNGEYVMTAQDVALLGNGSNEAGARKLDELRKRLRMDAGKKLVKGEQFMKAKSNPLAYANGGKS
jgi:hypothetical protein